MKEEEYDGRVYRTTERLVFATGARVEEEPPIVQVLVTVRPGFGGYLETEARFLDCASNKLVTTRTSLSNEVVFSGGVIDMAYEYAARSLKEAMKNGK